MEPTSIIAVYALFWVLAFFVVLPIGVRTDEEMGNERGHGHAESAPHTFSFGRAAFRATLVATPLFALFYFNYVNGWVGLDAIDWVDWD